MTSRDFDRIFHHILTALPNGFCRIVRKLVSKTAWPPPLPTPFIRCREKGRIWAKEAYLYGAEKWGESGQKKSIKICVWGRNLSPQGGCPLNRQHMHSHMQEILCTWTVKRQPPFFFTKYLPICLPIFGRLFAPISVRIFWGHFFEIASRGKKSLQKLIKGLLGGSYK